MDLSKFSDSDLDALSTNDLTKLSDSGLSLFEKLHKEEKEFADIKPDTGFTGAAKSSYEKMKGEGALVLGKLGLMDTQGAEDYYNKQKAKADKMFQPTEKGWDEAPFEKFRELLGSSAPYMVAPLAGAGAVAAGIAAAPEAAIAAGLATAGEAGAGVSLANLGLGITAPAVGGFLTNVGQFTGTNLGRQVDEGKSLNDTSLATAAAAAVPQSILDIASDHMIPGVKNIFGKAGINLTEKEASGIAKQQLLNNVPKGKIATALEYGGKAAQTAAIEGLNEAGQQVFERMQAGLDLTDPQARQEYFDNFIGGAVLGGAISVPGHYYDKNVEQPRQAKLLEAQRQAELRQQQLEEQQRQQQQLQQTYQNLNVPQTTNLLPAPEKAAPVPEKNMAPAIQQDMLQNYNGMFDQQAIDNVFGKGAFDQINEKREMEHGKPRLNQMSIEDLAHAGANPEDLSRLLTVQHDYTNVKEKNFAPAQILKMAEKKGIETGTGGFNSFLMRTTGTDNLQDMTYAQRHAVAKALDSVPINEGAKTILPEGQTNATPWHPADYDDAVKAVQADLAENKELSQADIMKTIHNATFLGQGTAPRAEDAKMLLDEMVRRGDVSLNIRPDKSSTPDNPKYLQTVIPAHPMANTPAGMDVRREVLGEGRGRREVFSLYENGERMGSFPTKQEAEEHGMSRLHDDILKQTITAAPHQLLPNGEIHPLARRYAEMAKNELNERQGISRDFRGVTTSQGLEGANERLAKLGIFNEKVQELAPEIKKDLEKRLRQYGLANIAVRMMDSIANGAAKAAYHAGLIKIALDAEDPMGELDHESVHALIDLGAFRPDELRVLENKAKSEWLQKYIKDTGKYDLYKKQYESEGRDMKTFEADMLEESVAEAFKHFNKQQPPAGMVGSLFKRISKFFEAVKNAFNGAGFKTADDIFEGITRGEFKPTRETTGQVKYSAAEQPRKIGEKIVGAPPNLSTEKDRTELVNRMTNLLEHPYSMYEKSKDWYERSGDTIKEIAHGDKALMEKVIRLTALYSQANSLGGNITAVIRSMAQLARGEQKILAGRFPETTAKRIPAILAAKTMDTSVAGVDDKLMNFYRNLHDGAFKTDTFKDSSTIDRWMMRLFGYPHSEDREKGGATGVSSTQYKYAKDLIKRIGDENEKRTGEKLKPRQIQAVLWTYVKNQSEAEKAKAEGKPFTPSSLDFSDYVKRATANITWESRPSTSIDLLPGIHNAPRQAQEAFNRAVRNIFETDDGKNKIFDLLGEGVLHSSQMSLGAYENQTAPNVITKVVLDKDNKGHMTDVANKAAAIIGYVTKQDAVPWYRADPTASGKNASVGYKVTPNVDVNPEFEEALFKHLNKEIPGIGFTRIDNGFDFINFRDENGKPFGMSDNEFLNKLQSALKSFDPNVNFGIDKFRAESAYIYNDWKEDKDGQGYLQRFSSKELANIQSTISNWRQNYDSIAKQFEKEYGWDKPTEAPAEKYSLKNAPPQRLTKLEEVESAGKRLNTAMRDVTSAMQDQEFWTGLRNNWIDKGSSLTKTLQNEEIYKDGVLRADLLNRAYAQVINLVKNGLQSGIPIFNNDGSVIIKQDAINNLANSQMIADKLDNNPFIIGSGIVDSKGKPSGRAYVAEVARALRGKEIMEEDARLGLKRELQVTPEQIAWAEKQLRNVPELDKIFSIWKNVNTALVNLWEQAGLIDKEEADSYRAKKHYVSLAASKADLEEMINNQYTIEAPGLKSTKKIFKLEGNADLDRNIWENIDKQYASMLTAAYQNAVRKSAVEQLKAIGMATTTRINKNGKEVPLYKGDKNINLRYKENGKIVDAIVHNQTDLAAFEAMHYELNPIMKGFAFSTKALRAGALLNPMFWIRQLIKDSIHSNIVANSGITTPFHSAAEFMRILMKDSEEAKILASRGVIGQFDSTIDIYDYLNQVGKEKSKPSTLDKALHKMMQVHEASDAATRVAIFKKEKANALTRGMTEADATNFAVMKARESINFAIHGNSKTLFYARHMVPFLSASITSLDTVYRAATGYGLPPAEKAAARKLFKQRAFMMAAMCTAYAMLMQNDDDYKKLPDYVKDNNWLIKNPTGDGFIKIPTPFEVGFLFKTFFEAGVRYMSGTSTGKEVLHSYWEGVTNNLPGNALPIPQLFKPAIETVTNHSFYTGNTIESLGDAHLPVEDRGRNASEISKRLSKSGLGAVGLSPAKIDNLIQGYMAELGTFTTGMADKVVYAAEGKTPPATNLAKDPFFKSFLTDPNADKAVSDFYQLEQNANQVAQEFTQLKGQGRAEEIQSFIKDKEKMQQIGAAPALRRIGQSMTAIKKQINFVRENQAMSPEARRDEINRLTAQYNRVAEQGVKLASSIGLPR